jgi:uncharacterized protein YaaQ
MDRAVVMKLIVAIVDERDAGRLMSALAARRIGVTHVSSSGGLFGPLKHVTKNQSLHGI